MSLPTSNALPGLGSPSLALPKFDDTLGALLIGGLIALALWGMICVQSYTYFMEKSRDHPALKLTIAALWFLDTFDSILDCHILYYYMVSNFLNPLAITSIVWSIIIHVAITSLSNFIIRLMFTYKVYALSMKNVWLTGWLIAVSSLDLAIGIYISVKAFGIKSFANLGGFSKYLYLEFATGTASDLSVALSLCILLYRSKTGFRRTDGLIRVLMFYIINTGLLVAFDAALGTILYAVMPRNLIFLAPYLCLSKLYLNSYLAALNARKDLRGKMTESLSVHLSELSQYPRHDRRGFLTTSEEEKSQGDELAISVQASVDKKVGKTDHELSTHPTRSDSGQA
ncbi:hypothetical protein AX15_003623 [Amanita polypyramis BW_CC]|nr:hypothetical protein AX15_003623 [Amanita polypyramis BW_CC]